MKNWIGIITNPLGLAAFALFLTFSLLAKSKRHGSKRWISPVAILMAFVTLLAGLTLSFLRTKSEVKGTLEPAELRALPQTNEIEQTTSGPNSPAVAGVKGDVNINVNQDSGRADLNTTKKKHANQQNDQAQGNK